MRLNFLPLDSSRVLSPSSISFRKSILPSKTVVIRMPAPKVEYAELTYGNDSLKIKFDMNVEGRDECGKIFDEKTLQVLDNGKGRQGQYLSMQ